MNSINNYLRFQKFGVVSIVVVYLLILVGGIVRSTGSGMGCPDWPTCFGRIIPPTKESELPPDYQEKYGTHGIAKFNPVKTWIEYLNRLLGASTGLVVLVLFISSFVYRKTNPNIVKLSGLILLLVIIEGVIGKYVVALNLSGKTVTIHFWGSIIIILLLIYLVSKTKVDSLIVQEINEGGKLKLIVFLLIVLTVIQVVLGTQVRQQLEQISIELDYTQRETWIQRLSPTFLIHRSFSILILLAHCAFLYYVRKSAGVSNILYKMSVLLMVILAGEVLAGIVLNYLDVPAFVQPVHMLLGSVLLGLQFFILIILNFSLERIKQNEFIKA